MSKSIASIIAFSVGFVLLSRYPALAKTVLYDDFETVPTTWSLAGLHASQVVTQEISHQGKCCLKSETDRFGFNNIRSGFRYKDERSRLSFWYYADYAAQDSPDARLTIGLRCETDHRMYTTRLKRPTPRQWQFMTLAATDVSPLLAGKGIDQLLVGLWGRAAPLRLFLDEVKLENEIPLPKTLPPRKPQVASSPWLPLGSQTLRAVAFSPATVSADYAQEMSDAGINAYFLVHPSERDLVQWVGLGEKYHAAVFAVAPMFYDVSEYLDKGQLRRAAFADGVPDILVCPLQEDYWHRFLTPILERWVDLSNAIPLAGVLLDLSAAGNVHPSYAAVDSCLCDECFSRFLEMSRIKENLVSFPMMERREWLRGNSLLLDYFDILERRVAIRSETLFSRLKKMNPRLLFGVFGFDDSWLGAGMLRGMSSPAMDPIVAAREPTSRQGFSIAVAWDSQRLKQNKVPNRWLPGFDLQQFSADELTEQLFVAARETKGYWIETAQAPDEKATATTAAPPKSSTRAIWEAIWQANHQRERGEKSQAEARDDRSRRTDRARGGRN